MFIFSTYDIFQDLQNQQIQTAMRLEEAVGSIVQEQNERELLEQAITHHDNTLRNVSKLGKLTIRPSYLVFRQYKILAVKNDYSNRDFRLCLKN